MSFWLGRQDLDCLKNRKMVAQNRLISDGSGIDY